MLRSAVIAFGAACVLLGGVLLMLSNPVGFSPLLGGLIIVLATVFERTIYKRTDKGNPGPGWTKTAERFVDEDTGQIVTVWIEPSSGERKYVRG